jgi:hydroxysqualene synthase
VKAIYHFARVADDIADEGIAAPEERLHDLQAYRQDLMAVFTGQAVSPRWSSMFADLAACHAQHALPLQHLSDLLSAFEQDVHNPRYHSRAELLAYCTRSANPVGRLLLHLYGIRDSVSLRQSDAICTALQLANFWQDLGVDLPRDRCYLPLEDLQAHGLTRSALHGSADQRGLRLVMRQLCQWTLQLFDEGAPLACRLPGRIGWELRLVVQGGLRVLEKIERQGFDTLTLRPKIGALDAPLLLWRALRMREAAPR